VVSDLTVSISGGPTAPADARRALRRWDETLDPELMQTVTLLVSELVTNAVRHTRARDITMLLEAHTSVVRVEVEDAGTGFTPRTAQPDPERPDGRGLYLVDELASRWGVRRAGVRNRVWFEIDR
jgi:anti-sigma regulatory factor (Ser/Thr protein kinase)